MPFVRALEADRFAVALEITPPQKSLPAVLLRRARLLEGYAMAVNVIQRPGRQSSLDASAELARAGLNPAWHLVTRGLTREQLVRDVRRAKTIGIRQALCIRGDHAVESTAPDVTVRDAVSVIGAGYPTAHIGVTFNQYSADPRRALRGNPSDHE